MEEEKIYDAGKTVLPQVLVQHLYIALCLILQHSLAFQRFVVAPRR
jgi:hypothetical protein